MKSLSRYVSLISLTGLLTGGGLLAQTSGSSTGASGSTGTSDANRSAATATSPYNSSATGSTTGSSSSTSGAMGSTGQYGSSNQPGTPSSMSTHSAAAGSLGTRNTASGSAFSGLTDPLVSSIQSGNYNSRAQVASDIEQRLDSQKEALKTLKNEGKRLQGQAKSDFNSAYDEVQAREKDLKRSLREARNASQDKWESARSELAANYQAFTAALARAQTQVGTGVSLPNSADSDSSHSLNRSTETSHTDSRTNTGALPNDPAASRTP